MFRTPLTMLSGESVESATYNGYSPGYTHRFNDDKTPTDDINFALMPSLMNAVYYMRPCFWVDANFFADVKVTGYENSEIVKQELKEQGYAKLNRVGYTDEEISALGITEKNWYGRYPKHPSKNDSEYYYFGDTGVSAEASETAANERKFSVGEKEYLLLDKDESGNYFIIQNSNKDKVKAYYSGGSTQNDGKLDEWRYNYADEKSVAYYLDNEYRMTMPNSIKDHLIKYDWHVEGNWPRHQNVPNQWLKDTIANNQPEVQSGYLALMSATELHAYKDVIGVMGTETTNWQGIQLRTRYSLAYNDQRSPLVAEYFKNSAGNIEINDSGINLATPQYYLRPCFWVDANFFANVKVTGYENSSIVKQVLKEQGYAKLNNAGYTNDEITSIGVTDRSRYGLYPTHPTQNNKILFRDGAADVSANNSNAEAAYTYNNGLADEYNNRPHISSAFGDNSTFVWYICSSDGSNKKAIADATENTLTVTANESGKYICVEVTPANGLGDVGEKQSLVYFVPEGTNELKINGVRLKNQNNTEIFDIGDVQNATALTVSVDVENLTDVQKDITLILTVYDNNKKLIGIQRTDLNSVEGNNGTLTLTTPSLNIKGADAKSVKVMLWNNFDEVKPYTKAIEVR